MKNMICGYVTCFLIPFYARFKKKKVERNKEKKVLNCTKCNLNFILHAFRLKDWRGGGSLI